MLATPSDPLFARQWSVQSGGADIAAALPYYRGDGVKLAILDDGFDASQADLAPNFDTTSSRAVTTGSSPTVGSGHGTAVAAVAGAAADGEGMVGAAPDADLIGLQLTFGTADLTSFEAAFRLAAQDGADVVNASWGFSGRWSDDPNGDEKGVIAAAKTLALTGRNGLGTNIVFAAGNAAATNDWTGDHGLQGAEWATTVGSFGTTGAASSFSTPGPGVLLSAPGEGIIAPVTGGYAYDTGTSFAAPLVSGTIALMLQANPGLGAADVQTILAETARLGTGTGSFDGGTNWNGGGEWYSTVFGHGELDAAAAVREAEVYFAAGGTGQGFAQQAQRSASGSGLSAPDGGQANMNFTLGAGVDISRIMLDLSGISPAGFSLTLRSPSGTTAFLGDASPGTSPSTWTYMSEAFRGEQSAGTWTITLQDPQADGQSASIAGLTLRAAGTQDTSSTRFTYTDDYSTLAAANPGRTILSDPGGSGDTLDLAPMSRADSVNLNSTVQSLGGAALTIAPGTHINTVFGGAGNDTIVGNDTGDTLYGGWGDDTIMGGAGNDILSGGPGNNTIDGGGGFNTAVYDHPMSSYQIGHAGDVILVAGPDGQDMLRHVQQLQFLDTTVSSSVSNAAVVSVQQNGTSSMVIAQAYSGPVAGLVGQWIGTTPNEVVTAGDSSVFLHLGGGVAAASGGAGNDVLDGGGGSDFLTGGGGNNVFFLDARAPGTTTWSTITDFHPGDQATIWGWQPGVSKASWEENQGAGGYTGATLRVDIDGKGTTSASLTFAGYDVAHAPSFSSNPGYLYAH